MNQHNVNLNDAPADPSWNDGCAPIVAQTAAIAAACLLLTFKLVSNRPLWRTPARPAQTLAWRVATPGTQGQGATYEVDCVCDDLKIRTFRLGADGVLRRKA